jgi:hypothetical protein
MPGWGTNSSRPNAASSREAHGTVRIPGEVEPLRVAISITESTVVMRADQLELGSWPASDVKISRIDPWSFAFVAEGDRLVFLPDDARSFAANPHVSASTGSETPTKSAKRVKMPRLRVRERSDESKKPVKVPRLRVKERSDEPVRTQHVVKRNPKPDEPSTTKQPRIQPREPEPDTKRQPTWLRAVDAARENGLFGLDRVPVSMQLRDREHQHTYDHGASSATGLGNRICTICGKVRIRR